MDVARDLERPTDRGLQVLDAVPVPYGDPLSRWLRAGQALMSLRELKRASLDTPDGPTER